MLKCQFLSGCSFLESDWQSESLPPPSLFLPFCFSVGACSQRVSPFIMGTKMMVTGICTNKNTLTVTTRSTSYLVLTSSLYNARLAALEANFFLCLCVWMCVVYQSYVHYTVCWNAITYWWYSCLKCSITAVGWTIFSWRCRQKQTHTPFHIGVHSRVGLKETANTVQSRIFLLCLIIIFFYFIKKKKLALSSSWFLCIWTFPILLYLCWLSWNKNSPSFDRYLLFHI